MVIIWDWEISLNFLAKFYKQRKVGSMEGLDSSGNQLLSVLIPTQPPISVGIHRLYPIPPVGGEFIFNFSAVIEDREVLGKINSLLGNEGLIVAEKNQNQVILRQGPIADIVKPDRARYMNEYYRFWYNHVEFSPYSEFPDPDLGSQKVVILGEREIRFTLPNLYPIPLPGGKLEINFAKVLESADSLYVEKLVKKQGLYCCKYGKEESLFQLGIAPDIKPNFCQSEQNRKYAFYWTRNPRYAPEYWLKEPFVLTYPGKPFIRIEIPPDQRIFLPGISKQIDWKKFLPAPEWERIKEELEEDGPYADEWVDTKTIIHDRNAFNPNLWF